MKPKKFKTGFTMIELTIVMSIIGILAAIAIPDFLKFQSRARQAEAKVLVGSIASREMQYKLETGSYLACPKNPAKPGGKWDNQIAEWNQIGFGVTGPILYQYEVTVDDKGFVVKASGEIDKDGNLDEWMIGSDPNTGCGDLGLCNTYNDVGD